MRFKPSKYSSRVARRNWSKRFPESSLTVGSQRGAPIPGHLQENASLLSNFLWKLPFPVSINSAYRSPSVNAAVGGTSSSQHMNALAVDIQPPLGMPNFSLATWFWLNQWFFPELDQVIVYRDGRSHLHVGICPKGASGCPGGAPRKQFRQYAKLTRYTPWIPSPMDMPQHILGVGPLGLAVWTTLGAAALGAAYLYQDELRDLAGV